MSDDFDDLFLMLAGLVALVVLLGFMCVIAGGVADGPVTFQ